MSGDQRAQAPEKLDITDVKNLTARLAQVLAEEADYLAQMKIGKIQELQQEKQFLIRALEAHRKLIKKNPSLSETIPSRDKEDLQSLVNVFEDILAENHRRLQMAKEVNQRIVQTVAQVVKEQATSKVYGDKGMVGAMGTQNVSLTVNQTA